MTLMIALSLPLRPKCELSNSFQDSLKMCALNTRIKVYLINNNSLSDFPRPSTILSIAKRRRKDSILATTIDADCTESVPAYA